MLYIKNDLFLDTRQILSFSEGQAELIAVHLNSMDLVAIVSVHLSVLLKIAIAA